MKYAIIDDNGEVLNVIVWDGTTPIEESGTLVPLPTTTYEDLDGNDYEAQYGGPGWKFDGTGWIAPPPDPDDE